MNICFFSLQTHRCLKCNHKLKLKKSEVSDAESFLECPSCGFCITVEKQKKRELQQKVRNKNQRSMVFCITEFLIGFIILLALYCFFFLQRFPIHDAENTTKIDTVITAVEEKNYFRRSSTAFIITADGHTFEIERYLGYFTRDFLNSLVGEKTTICYSNTRQHRMAYFYVKDTEIITFESANDLCHEQRMIGNGLIIFFTVPWFVFTVLVGRHIDKPKFLQKKR